MHNSAPAKRCKHLPIYNDTSSSERISDGTDHHRILRARVDVVSSVKRGMTDVMPMSND